MADFTFFLMGNHSISLKSSTFFQWNSAFVPLLLSNQKTMATMLPIGGFHGHGANSQAIEIQMSFTSWYQLISIYFNHQMISNVPTCTNHTLCVAINFWAFLGFLPFQPGLVAQDVLTTVVSGCLPVELHRVDGGISWNTIGFAWIFFRFRVRLGVAICFLIHFRGFSMETSIPRPRELPPVLVFLDSDQVDPVQSIVFELPCRALMS